MNLVTVAIVAHNESSRISPCLTSILRQKNVDQFPILVIDNGSTDETAAKAREILEQSHWPRFKVFSLNENNLGAARARAVSLAETELVAFLDADCEADENWLYELIEAWESLTAEYANVAAVGGPFVFIDEGSDFSRWRAAMSGLWLAHLGAEQADHSQPITVERQHLPTANVLYSKVHVLQAGNFSAAFAQVCEDVDLSLRLRSSGAQLFWTPAARVVHRQGGGWSEWAERIFRYGKGQAAARGMRFWNWPLRLQAPVWGLLILVNLGLRPQLWFDLGLIYFLLVALTSILNRRVAWRDLIPVAGMLILTHAAYGLGILLGLLKLPHRLTIEPISTAEK